MKNDRVFPGVQLQWSEEHTRRKDKTLARSVETEKRFYYKGEISETGQQLQRKPHECQRNWTCLHPPGQPIRTNLHSSIIIIIISFLLLCSLNYSQTNYILSVTKRNETNKSVRFHCWNSNWVSLVRFLLKFSHI